MDVVGADSRRAEIVGGFEVLHGVSIPIEDGAFVVLVGPSGCGKSTLLRMLAGLENITSGTISIGRPRRQQRPAQRTRHRHGVPELCALSAYDGRRQYGISLKLRGASSDEISKGVNRAAEILALTPLLDRYPRQLSGGQRQRVAMGRAIVRDPQVFLFDEPLSNLDAKLRVGDAHRNQGTAPAAEDHHRLRHPRPDRSHDHGRQDRGDA